MTKLDKSVNSFCVVNVDNDSTGVQFVFGSKGDEKSHSFDVDEGHEKGSLRITPEYEGEVSVMFPEGAWVTVENSQIVVKFASYGADNAYFEVYPYDYVG